MLVKKGLYKMLNYLKYMMSCAFVVSFAQMGLTAEASPSVPSEISQSPSTDAGIIDEGTLGVGGTDPLLADGSSQLPTSTQTPADEGSKPAINADGNSAVSDTAVLSSEPSGIDAPQLPAVDSLKLADAPITPKPDDQGQAVQSVPQAPTEQPQSAMDMAQGQAAQEEAAQEAYDAQQAVQHQSLQEAGQAGEHHADKAGEHAHVPGQVEEQTAQQQTVHAAEEIQEEAVHQLTQDQSQTQQPQQQETLPVQLPELSENQQPSHQAEEDKILEAGSQLQGNQLHAVDEAKLAEVKAKHNDHLEPTEDKPANREKMPGILDEHGNIIHEAQKKLADEPTQMLGAQKAAQGISDDLLANGNFIDKHN